MIFLGPGAGNPVCQVIDVTSANSCNNLSPYPLQINDASAGGVISGIPVICGGRTSNGEESACYGYNKNSQSWDFSVNMVISRMRPASAILDSGVLWVTGGYTSQNNEYYLKSTEYIFVNGEGNLERSNGPDLSEARIAHCMVTLHDGIIMILGGSYLTGTSVMMTLTGDPDQGFSDESGPTLLFDRLHAACVVFNSPLHGNRPVVIVAGGVSQVTAEILDYTVSGSSWEQSKTHFKIVKHISS